jgi:maltose O-acetyltransferase
MESRPDRPGVRTAVDEEPSLAEASPARTETQLPALGPPPKPGLRQKLVATLYRRYYFWRIERRWNSLRAMGMHLGVRCNLPLSTWIDTSHCHLVSIGDNCGFGDGCVILAHDAMCNQWLDATRVGRVTIHDSCHFGARTVILPGVEIGPRAIVGAGSVVTRSIPADSVAAGNPARVLCTLDELLAKQKKRMEGAPTFPFELMDQRRMTEEFRQKMRELLDGRDGYVVGGIAATLAGRGHKITR